MKEKRKNKLDINVKVCGFILMKEEAGKKITEIDVCLL